ncbi:hypothetical protein [Myxococcus xanthus]|uniref:Uncharacterized protein n=1 Tax=Myxococcus xanthus TaxID=34 RepID=A0A7Y4III7_MYXXA|nr:hypothetical protein [Myxococcus xanthus]NOJ79794.1 hypothetical protein [Myxococcus xanthus]NOJ86799.1 hypothetical protein [Myxococcus xanthus]
MAANIELFQMGDVYPSGQVLEAILGYDVAATPRRESAIWKLLGTSAPKGILLLPSHWGKPNSSRLSTQLPDKKTSLFFQYKRSRHIKSKRAKQWNYWRCPYFRFTIDEDQQSTLEDLEAKIEKLAIIRYAAPAFCKYRDLLRLQRESNILNRSTFISPSLLRGHQTWSFISEGLRGYANAEPQEIELENIDTLFLKLHDPIPQTTLPGHLRQLALALGLPTLSDKQNPPNWVLELIDENAEHSRELYQAILDFANISTVLGGLGISWSVYSRSA